MNNVLVAVAAAGAVSGVYYWVKAHTYGMPETKEEMGRVLIAISIDRATNGE